MKRPASSSLKQNCVLKLDDLTLLSLSSYCLLPFTGEFTAGLKRTLIGSMLNRIVALLQQIMVSVCHPVRTSGSFVLQACYLVDALARQIWTPVSGRCKDYISTPKPNGYQSLHTTVRVTSVTVELLAKDSSDNLPGEALTDSSSSSIGGGGGGSSSPKPMEIEGPALEVQIRTAGVCHLTTNLSCPSYGSGDDLDV